MTDTDPDKNGKKNPDTTDPSRGIPAGQPLEPVAMTLEAIIDQTGEMEHLNGLVMRSLEREGGFTCSGDYFRRVHPILDQLEVEIRTRYRQGMSRNDLKLIIQDWIDEEIRRLR